MQLVPLAMLTAGLAWVSFPAVSRCETDVTEPSVRFIEVDAGVKLEVLDWDGNGPYLVLLTGLGNTAHVYSHFAHQFTDRFHVIAITRRGFGHSSRPARGYDVATRARDDIRVLDALKIAKAVFVGHSIAGDELSKLGGDYAERVVKLVYLDSVDYGAFGAVLKKTPLPPPPALSAAEEEFVTGNVAGMAALNVRSGGVRWPDEEILQHVKTEATRRGVTRNGESTPYQATQDLCQPADYARIRAPVLAIYDVITRESRMPYYWDLDQAQKEEYDRFAANYQAWLKDARQRFRIGVKHARIVELEKFHHHIFIRDEAVVAQEVRKFLLEK